MEQEYLCVAYFPSIMHHFPHVLPQLVKFKHLDVLKVWS